QAGIENVVSSSGTSLTKDQIKLIARFTKNITILYDGDAAGIKASFRGIDMILEQGLNVKVVSFPNGEDPDSYARTHRSAEVEEYIAIQSVDFIKFKTNLLLDEVQGDPIKKAELIKDILHSISLIPDNIYRSVYIQECSHHLQIAETDLIAKLNKIVREKAIKNKQAIPEQVDAVSAEVQEEPAIPFGEEQEKEILRLLLVHGERATSQIFVDDKKVEFTETLSVANYIVEEVELNELTFTNELYQDIFNVFASGVKQNKIPTINFFLQHQNEKVKQMVVDLCTSPYELSPKWIDKGIYVYSETDPHKLDESVFESVLAFKIKKIEGMIHQLEEQMRAGIDEKEEDLFMFKKKQLDEMRCTWSQKLRRVIV
ncbi:MAG: toprim domain-containing protein, partial [Bacteroidales bacterium]